MINDGLPPSVRLSALRQFGMMLLAVVACCVEQTVAKAFPAEIEHRFGVARITKQPKRVVSISLIGHDFLLALDVKPVGLRRWYGSHPFGVWPWAQDQLGDAKPAVMQGEIDIERVALLRPDLIEAQWSGMTAREYHLLSQIAPTLGPAKGAGDYGTSWMEMLRRLGAATGHTRKADQVIDRIEGRFRAIRKANPAWLGATATMSWAGAIGAYRRTDLRGQFLEQLGFKVPDIINDMPGGNEFFVTMPSEDLSPMDVDALVWLDIGGSVSRLKALPLRYTMRAYKEGREVYADPMLSAALSHSSPLSLEYALDQLVPLLEKALDGDPATVVPSSAAVGLAPVK